MVILKSPAHLLPRYRDVRKVWSWRYLHIQIRAPCVAFDETFAGRDLVSHEHAEDFVGFHGLFDGDLQDGAMLGVHRGVPEGLGVHFAQTFVTPNLRLLAVMRGFVLDDKAVPFFFGVDVMDLLAHFDVVERRLRNIKMAGSDQGLHMAEEEGEQQGANMRAVHVGIAHDDDATITQAGYIEVFIDADSNGRNDVFDFFVFEDFIQPDTLDVENFAAQWENSLEVSVAPLLRAIMDKNSAC